MHQAPLPINADRSKLHYSQKERSTTSEQNINGKVNEPIKEEALHIGSNQNTGVEEEVVFRLAYQRTVL